MAKVLLLLSLAAAVSAQFNGILFPRPGVCVGSKTDKIQLVQNMYIQYVHLKANVPPLKGFHTCLWINIAEIKRISTIVNYAMDETNNTDNMTIQYDGRMNKWTMNLNGRRVYDVPSRPLNPDTWYHSCHSWDSSTGSWTIWQNGELVAGGINPRFIGVILEGGGRLVAGQHQKTLFNGMDVGEGLIGTFTLLHISSSPLDSANNPQTQRYVYHISRDCKLSNRGDVVDWVTTPRGYYGGATTEPAKQICQAF